jgi:hypothetical protein
MSRSWTKEDMRERGKGGREGKERVRTGGEREGGGNQFEGFESSILCAIVACVMHNHMRWVKEKETEKVKVKERERDRERDKQ